MSHFGGRNENSGSREVHLNVPFLKDLKGKQAE